MTRTTNSADATRVPRADLFDLHAHAVMGKPARIEELLHVQRDARAQRDAEQFDRHRAGVVAANRDRLVDDYSVAADRALNFVPPSCVTTIG